MLVDCKPAQDAITAPENSDMPLRILFLGNAYNPLSVACLLALARSEHQIVVGVHDATSVGPRRLILRAVRRHGLPLVMYKALRLGRARARVALRRAGCQLRSVASLPELLSVRQLPTIPCANPNRADFVAQVREQQFDLVVVAAFSRILKQPLIGLPRLGCINVHLSMLPRYRGPHPIYWALSQGEARTGVTIHYIDEGIDSGDVILQRAVEIRPGDTEARLHARATAAAADLLPQAVRLIAAGTAPRIPQDESQASYFSFPPKGTLTLL
jgi:methionyl-tRNA formyltransferase